MRACTSSSWNVLVGSTTRWRLCLLDLRTSQPVMVWIPARELENCLEAKEGATHTSKTSLETSTPTYETITHLLGYDEERFPLFSLRCNLVNTGSFAQDAVRTLQRGGGDLSSLRARGPRVWAVSPPFLSHTKIQGSGVAGASQGRPRTPLDVYE